MGSLKKNKNKHKQAKIETKTHSFLLKCTYFNNPFVSCSIGQPRYRIVSSVLDMNIIILKKNRCEELCETLTRSGLLNTGWEEVKQDQ